MLPHIKLFILLGSLFLGGWSVVRLRQIAKRFPYPFLDALVRYTALVGIAFLGLFVFVYTDLNLSRVVARPLPAPYRDAIDWFLSWLVIGLLFFMLQIVLGLLDRRVPAALERATAATAAAIGAGYLLRMLVPAASPGLAWLDWIRAWVIENALLLEIVLLIYLGVRARTMTEPLRRTMTVVFAVLYLGRYAVAVGLLVGAKALAMAEWLQLAVSSTLLVAFLSLPVVWAERYVVPFVERAPRVPEEVAWWEGLAADYRLSKPEVEVLRLLLIGKSNKEIEALLGVSVHTVKNHVYNIFNKVGVDSRYQLVHLLLNRRTGR